MTPPRELTIRGEAATRRVWLDGAELTPEESLKVFNHSPDGFCWGYGGSGPAQLALAILLRLTDKRTALARYQSFKWDFIANLPQGDFTATIPAAWLERVANRKAVADG